MKRFFPLCIVLLPCCGCGASNETALSEIRQLGGVVTLASSGGFGSQQVYIEIKGRKGDKELEALAPHLKKVSKITGLHMHGSSVTDNGLAHLKGVNNIDHFILENTGITDRGLEHLKHMDKLRFLDVTGTQVTEQGILELKRALPKLQIEKLSATQAKAQDEIHKAGGQTIYVGRTLEKVSFKLSHLGRDRRLNDADLTNLKEHLEAWKETLKKLDLTDTDVTDAGLAQLKGLTNLEELTLTGTKVTEEGTKALERERPGLKIRH